MLRALRITIIATVLTLAGIAAIGIAIGMVAG